MMALSQAVASAVAAAMGPIMSQMQDQSAANVQRVIQQASFMQQPQGHVMGGQRGDTPPGSRTNRLDHRVFSRVTMFKGEVWSDWCWAFKNATASTCIMGAKLLDWAEKQTDIINDYDDFESELFDTVDEGEVEQLSASLYTVMGNLMHPGSEALDIVKNTPGRNGAEAWRKLSKRYAPTTPLRGMYLMMQVVGPKRAGSPQEVASSVEKWETHVLTLERDFKERLSDPLKTAILLSIVPKDLQDTLVQHTVKFDNYQEARDRVMTVAESKILLKNPHAMDVGKEEYEGPEQDWDDQGEQYEYDLDAAGKAGGKNRKPICCFKCGGQGHIAAKCASPGLVKGKGRCDWQGYCSICGKRGHGPR